MRLRGFSISKTLGVSSCTSLTESSLILRRDHGNQLRTLMLLHFFASVTTYTALGKGVKGVVSVKHQITVRRHHLVKCSTVLCGK